MSETRRILIAEPLPALVLPVGSRRRARQLDPLPRLARLLWLAAVFSLPVLGLTVADLVHRVGEPGAMQAAAPSIPSAGAAVPSGVIRVGPAIRMTSSGLLHRGGWA
jgi:hypothetical protein